MNQHNIGDIWRDGRAWKVKLPGGIHTTTTKRQATAFTAAMTQLQPWRVFGHRPRMTQLPDPVTLHGYTFTFEWLRCGANPSTYSACYAPFKLIKTKRTGIGYLDSTRVGFCREHGQPFSADVTIELESIARDRRARSDASEASSTQRLKDARLLAAAPALLEAAQAMYELHKDGVSHQLQFHQRAAAIVVLRAAIAAATGEEGN